MRDAHRPEVVLSMLIARSRSQATMSMTNGFSQLGRSALGRFFPPDQLTGTIAPLPSKFEIKINSSTKLPSYSTKLDIPPIPGSPPPVSPSTHSLHTSPISHTATLSQQPSRTSSRSVIPSSCCLAYLISLRSSSFSADVV